MSWGVVIIYHHAMTWERKMCTDSIGVEVRAVHGHYAVGWDCGLYGIFARHWLKCVQSPSRFSPTAIALGFQSPKGRFGANSGSKTEKVSWGYSYDYSYGVNKLLDSKRSFLKPDYHYTTIFLAP